MNKKIIFKVLALVLSVAMMFGMSTVAFASENIFTETITIGDEADSSNTGISTASYIDPESFTFTYSNVGAKRTMDGRYLAYEYNITNTNSSYITISTYVDSRCVDTRNVTGSGKADWIDMKSSKNHTVQFMYYTASAGQHATIDMKMYSWE